jgi:excisionase family DNA binding protein
MPKITTTQEMANYLKLHEITICKYATEGKIPAVRIGKVWRSTKKLLISG